MPSHTHKSQSHSSSNKLNVATIQLSCSSTLDNIDKTAMLTKISNQIEAASSRGAQLILLQELHSTPYFCQIESDHLFSLAEPLDGETNSHLASLAKRHSVVIVSSIFERRAAGIFHNTAAVLDRDGTMAGIYRKMHIPHDPGFYEKYYFTPGDVDGLKPIQTSIGRLGVLVCWDQWYPEAARIMALKGADLLLYPTAIGWDRNDDPAEQQRQLDAWITIQRSHAIANHLPVIVSNRTGFEEDPTKQGNGIQFWGNSFVAGPQGEWLASPMNSDHEGILLAEVDLQRREKLRQIWPYFRDRRIDAYGTVMQRYGDET